MYNIIPYPFSVKEEDGSFIITDDLTVKSHFDLPLFDMEQSKRSNFKIVKADSIPAEGYKLKVTPDTMTIEAPDEIGAYYAINTIKQMCNYEFGGRKVPCCEIYDYPKYSWRGINLDESRHFFGVDAVKRLLDIMFMNKLNVFHWHLTDDQGWRLEIKKYPLLTEIGSKRSMSQIGGWHSTKCDHTEYGGFYTQEEIKEIVEYASQRGISIVPEIDFPAHCASAIAPYKELACREIESEVQGFFGGKIPEMHGNFDWNRTVCCGKESTFEFIFGVLDEVCELFPSSYIHMGGDEAPTKEWKKCDKCQKVIRDNALQNERELQGWFENRIIEYLKTKNKTLIGWNEMLKAECFNRKSDNVAIQYWTPNRDVNAEKFANSGGKTIISKHQSFYFDMTYAQYPLDKTYNFTETKFGINPSDNILGVEGELWTEWIPDIKTLDLRAFPRMQALSEVAWLDENKRNWEDFKKRLDNQKPLLDKLGIYYARDEVCMPKGLIKRGIIQRKFFKGNPLLEVELNDKVIQKEN